MSGKNMKEEMHTEPIKQLKKEGGMLVEEVVTPLKQSEDAFVDGLTNNLDTSDTAGALSGFGMNSQKSNNPQAAPVTASTLEGATGFASFQHQQDAVQQDDVINVAIDKAQNSPQMQVLTQAQDALNLVKTRHANLPADWVEVPDIADVIAQVVSKTAGISIEVVQQLIRDKDIT